MPPKYKTQNKANSKIVIKIISKSTGRRLVKIIIKYCSKLDAGDQKGFSK